MFDHGFPKHWTTLKKLIWLKGAGIIGGASAIWKTLTGTLIHITDALAAPMQKCEVALEPIQDLHGQDFPYPGGGGKNKLQVTGTSQTINDVTFTVNADGTINVSGTASGATTYEIEATTDKYNGQEWKINGTGTATGVAIWVYDGSSRVAIASGSNDATFTGSSTIRIIAYVYANTATSGTLKPMVRLSSVTDNTFAPYKNICPITGWTGCKLWVKDEYDTSLPATASVTFPDGKTVYGGEYEFVSGNLKPYKEYDSYNGETLTGRWMSSMDKYVAGTTPTIGAQVVDLDSYDTTVQLTPQEISTLAVENNIWADCGDTTIIYKAQA